MTAREKAGRVNNTGGGSGAQVTYFDAQGKVELRVEILPEENRCGFGSCFSPEWLQVLASKKAFMVVFAFLAVVQGMQWSYFSATITQLEKQFKISSQTAGIVMTGNEISQILFSIILSYYGGKGHRPRWIATGVLLSGISCFVLASPHFIYGPGKDALENTVEFMRESDPSFELPTTPTPVEMPSRHSSNQSVLHKFFAVGSYSRPPHMCDPSRSEDNKDCDPSDLTIIPLVLIFCSQFIMGIGVLLFFSLGGPYLDDNVDKTKSPMLFGITMCLRLVGPTLGYMLAFTILDIYVAPSLTPLLNAKDPLWIGAWWLGWVILGSIMILTSFSIAMFPRELPRATLRRKLNENMQGSQASLARFGSQVIQTGEKANENALPKLSEIPGAVKTLLRNKINLYNNLAGVFYLFSAIGYWTYAPKYLETIFMQTAVRAAGISGIISIAFQSVGLLISGWLISKYQPRARVLAGWNVCLGALYVLVKISFTQLGCEPGIPNFGERNVETGTWNLSLACNADCHCKTNKIDPICWPEKNEIFFSSCHAGCSDITNNTIISNCSCLADPMTELQRGTCKPDCFNAFLIFLAVNAVIKLLDSSGRIGNMLVSYRCVDPKDKSLAIGLSIFLISIFAMLPSPILFGRICDSACYVWGTKCGGRGNCWLYDGERLRYWFNLTAAACTAIGTFFDVLVWYYVKDLDLYDEDKNVRDRKLKERAKAENR